MTIISLSKECNEENFKEVFNYEAIPQHIKNILLATDYFTIPSNQEVLFYKGRQITFSCSYEEWYNKIVLKNCWNRQSENIF